MTKSKTRFSPAASRLFTWAKSEALRLQSPNIEPEHILLGLLREKEGEAYNAIDTLGKDIEAIEKMLMEKLNKLPSVQLEDVNFSEQTQIIIEKSAETAGTFNRRYLGTEHLLLGLLRSIDTDAYLILRKFNISYSAVVSLITKSSQTEAEKKDSISLEGTKIEVEKISFTKIILNISPIFLGMIGIVIFTGISAYQHLGNTNIAIFYFITFGWVISLSLHEFGHAYVAYLGGDDSVIEKGYLSLNPLKYTHGFLSIVLPLLFLAMGGIGLPGGAVFINMEKIADRKMKSLVSFAGPLMNMLFAMLLSVPFLFNLISEDSFSNHYEFWAGMGFLIFVQITAIFFNLFPLPGLDGFGVIRPFLSESLLKIFAAIRPFSLLILLMFVVGDSQIGEKFWALIFSIIDFAGIPRIFINIALELYRFWQ
jgi:Zn-dependent protease